LKKIAVYGKGGSGKSTISAALSVVFARRGLKVLHVGCDPKADSTFTLTGGKRITTLLDLLAQGRTRPDRGDFVVRGRLGIDCIEAGGPKPGAGCGGRGIARMFELFGEMRLLEDSDYDVVMFDVLGDVVCGGFAAPLRLGFADRAFIVVSEEPLSIYAANNIVHAIDSYSANGVRLGGLILNVSDDDSGKALVGRFASAIGAPLAGTIPRDKAIQEAERRHLTAAELSDNSPTTAAIEELAETVLLSFNEEGSLPRPLDVGALFSVMDKGGPAPDAPIGPEVSSTPASAPESQVQEEQPAEPVPAPSRVLPDGSDVTAGPEAHGVIASMLGLDSGKAHSLHLEVVEAIYRRQRFYVTLEAPAVGRLTLELGLADGEKKTYARKGDLAIAHITPLKPATRQVLDFVVRRLGRIDSPLALLERAFVEDTETMAEVSEEERKDEQKRTVGFSPRHWSVWGSGGTTGVFIFEQERRRQVLAEVRIGDGAIHVHHGTEACQASEQDTNLYSSHFVRHPWRLDGGSHEERSHESSYLTNLRDHHLIAGSNDALAGVLDEVLARGGTAPVCVDVSCTPVIAGEDWQGSIGRFAKRYEGPVLASAVGGTDLSQTMVKAGLEVLGQDSRVGPPGRLHLVGFPMIRGCDELIELLGIAGIEVLERQLPGVSLSGLSRYGEGCAQLLWPQAEYEPLYDGLFRQSQLPAVVVPPPFGPEGTRAMIAAAATAAGMDPDDASGKLSSRFAAVEAELTKLRPRAAEIRIGVALTAGQAGMMDSPARMCGIPVREFLEGLGFRVEVLDDSQDPARLNWWLRSGLNAVLTDLTFDERLFAAGVAPFGLADLEPGLEGALRTMRGLLRLSRTRFFANYSGFGGGSR